MLKNKGVLAVILLLLVAAIGYNVRFFYRRMHPQRATTVAATSPPPTSEGKKIQTAEREEVKEKVPFGEREEKGLQIKKSGRKRELNLHGWGRNPFFDSSEIAQLTHLKSKKRVQGKEKKEEVYVSLSGIITVSGEKMAILNNHVMTEGEAMGEVKLLKVLPSAVWVLVSNQRRWVPLPQPKLSLIAQEVVSESAQRVLGEKKK